MDADKKVFSAEEAAIETPLLVYCQRANSFPDGIMAAHQALHGKVSFSEQRRYFGVSWGGGEITYLAAVTELEEGELAGLDLEPFEIKSGNYLAVDTEGYDQIQLIFQQLITDSRVDPEGYCLEDYQGANKVRCLVKIKD